jgi:crotonobetaine/carnitine-CoA ligase
LPAVLRSRAKTHRGKVFVRIPHEGYTATYDQIDEDASKIALSLLSLGGRAGERVLIFAGNSHEHLLTWFGCSYAGLIDVPINTAYFGRILDHQIGLAAPRFAVVETSLAPRLIESNAAKQNISNVILIGDDGADLASVSADLRSAGFRTASFESLMRDAATLDLPTCKPSDNASILFTSGTTGPSKGVLLPHAQLHLGAETMASMTLLDENDVYLAPGPLFHGNARFVSTYPAMVVGGEIVLLRKFSASGWIDSVRENRVTVANLIGVMMDFVWKQPPSPLDNQNDLRCVVCTPTAWSIAEEFKARFDFESLVESYGMTEVAVPILTPYGESRPKGAVGLLLSDCYEARLADPETDEVVGSHEKGELLLRPRYPWTMNAGYVGMPEATVLANRNLWFHTGDAFRVDEDGWYYFIDRTNDALRRRGENISSYEVEQPILQHPSVAECAVIGVPSGIDGGEAEVLAVIVTVPGASLTAKEVWQWCEERMPAFTIPRYIRFLDGLPKTPTEKVQKITLREQGVTVGTADRWAQSTQQACG